MEKIKIKENLKKISTVLLIAAVICHLVVSFPISMYTYTLRVITSEQKIMNDMSLPMSTQFLMLDGPGGAIALLVLLNATLMSVAPTEQTAWTMCAWAILDMAGGGAVFIGHTYAVSESQNEPEDYYRSAVAGSRYYDDDVENTVDWDAFNTSQSKFKEDNVVKIVTYSILFLSSVILLVDACFVGADL